mgnify:FL=1
MSYLYKMDLFNKELFKFLNSVEAIFAASNESRADFDKHVSELDVKYPFIVTVALMATHFRLCEMDPTTSELKIVRENIVANYKGTGYPINIFLMFDFFYNDDSILCKDITRILFSITDTSLLKERVFDFLWEFLAICK